MNLPKKFIEHVKNLLKEDFERFMFALSEVSPVSVRANDKVDYQPTTDKVKWCGAGFYLAERPLFTADPFLHAGVYYVQEASSMFLQQALEQLVPKNSVILDLSAAPGGKSTLISQHVDKQGFLVSNEIVRSRAYILAENMIKWGNDSFVVTNNEPKDFQQLPAFFDVVVVDAPCSGEGMFRKDAASINEWSDANAAMCAARQRDILADVWHTLKPDGTLIYSTCTYNAAENEENVKWLETEFDAEFVPLNIDEFPEITFTGKGYRFYPHKTRGEGFFIAALRKNGAAIGTTSKKKTKKPLENGGKEAQQLKKWLINPEMWKIYQEDNIVSAFRLDKVDLLEAIKSRLKILHAGVILAEQKGRDFIPHTSLALYKQLNNIHIQSAEVNYQTAISYLRKETLFLPDAPTGFVLLTYKNVPIGWVKNVGNRCNNLYPNEWRIRMKL